MDNFGPVRNVGDMNPLRVMVLTVAALGACGEVTPVALGTPPDAAGGAGAGGAAPTPDGAAGAQGGAAGTATVGTGGGSAGAGGRGGAPGGSSGTGNTPWGGASGTGNTTGSDAGPTWTTPSCYGGEPCPINSTCMSGGACACLTGLDWCGTNTCVWLQTDPSNCGKCGNACPSGMACYNGACH